jgi:hypothetical protein
MVDIIDAGTYISLELLVIFALIATGVCLKKNHELGLKVGAGAVVLIALYAAFPKLVGSLLTLGVCLFFLAMAFSG